MGPFKVHKTSADIQREDVSILLETLAATDAHRGVKDFDTGISHLRRRDDRLVFTIPSRLKEDAYDGSALCHGLASAIADLEAVEIVICDAADVDATIVCAKDALIRASEASIGSPVDEGTDDKFNFHAEHGKTVGDFVDFVSDGTIGVEKPTGVVYILRQ